MRPSKSVLVVATLASALLPPRVARVLGTLVLICLVGMTLWIGGSADVSVGRVVQTLPAADGRPAFASITSPEGEAALLLPTMLPALPVEGDIVIASGTPQTIAGVGDFLRVSDLTVLPLADLRGKVADSLVAAQVKHIHPAGLVLGALLLAGLAPLILRLTSSAAMAAATFAVGAILWHLNRGPLVVPLPADVQDTVLLGAAILGAVAGWKAMGEDPDRIGRRIGALLLLPLVLPALRPLMGPLPPALLLVFIPVAILRPTLIPVAAALPLIDRAMDLTPTMLAAIMVVLVTLRLWRDYVITARPVAAGLSPTTTFEPRTDNRGAFDLTQIFEPRKEA